MHRTASAGEGMSVRNIQDTLQELYGVEVSPTTLSAITDKVWGLVEEWQNRSLASLYPIVYLDALQIKLRREGRVENIAVYTVLGVDVEGHRDILGHWVGDGNESSNFWLSVITDLQTRGVQDIFIACMDGLSGFKEADADPALHHSPNSQQPQVYYLDGSQGFHARSEDRVSSLHPRKRRSAVASAR